MPVYDPFGSPAGNCGPGGTESGIGIGTDALSRIVPAFGGDFLRRMEQLLLHDLDQPGCR